MRPINLTVPLSHGSVSLRAWGAHMTDALTLDLMTMTATLAELMANPPEDLEVGDVEGGVWAAFHRLLSYSLDGTIAPTATTFAERVALLSAMWELNSLPEALGKLAALGERAGRAMAARLAPAEGRPQADDDGTPRPPDSTDDEHMLREFGPAEYEALRRLPPALLERALQIRREERAADRLRALDDTSIASGLTLGREHIDPNNRGGPKPGEPYVTHDGLKKHREMIDREARPWAYTEEALWQREEDEFEALGRTLGGAVHRA